MVPLHAIDEIYEEDKNFAKIQNFALKESLGDDIYIDYQKPFLIFKTNNPFGDFLNEVYEISGLVPVIGTIKNGIELTEGLIKANEEQIIDSGVGLLLDTMSFGFGKILKQPGKVIVKNITKGTTKTVGKKHTKKKF